jgi:hypothetical protein
MANGVQHRPQRYSVLSPLSDTFFIFRLVIRSPAESLIEVTSY